MKTFTTVLIFIFTLVFIQSAQADENTMKTGETVFNHWCAPCHDPGMEHPGTMALAAKYKGEIEPVLASRTGMTKEFVAQFVREGVSVMPFFRKTEISDTELDALSEYLMRNDN